MPSTRKQTPRSRKEGQLGFHLIIVDSQSLLPVLTILLPEVLVTMKRLKNPGGFQQLIPLDLTNKEASTVLCSVVKHAGSG